MQAEVIMYCDHCGKRLNPGSQYCTSCGLRVLPGVGPASYGAQALAVAAGGRVRQNIELLSVLWMINGVLRLLETFAFSFLGPMVLPGLFGACHLHGWIFPFSSSAWPLSMGFAWIGILFGAFGIVHLILSWGLHERKMWARPLGLVVGFLALIRFPLGTALGIYTLWVLLPEPSRREYDQFAVV
jgi:uncharacterized membrane protein (DUF2068 family)